MKHIDLRDIHDATKEIGEDIEDTIIEIYSYFMIIPIFILIIFIIL